MRIEKSHKIELICSKDATRPHLTNAHLDVEKKRLYATNGHTLVSLAVITEEGDVTGQISPDAIKAARKVAKLNNGDVVIGANGKLAIPNGPEFPRPTDLDAPPHEKVIPSKHGSFQISFSAKYLWEIAQALGSQNDGQVLLKIDPEDPLAPIVVVDAGDNDNLGVLMPCRF